MGERNVFWGWVETEVDPVNPEGTLRVLMSAMLPWDKEASTPASAADRAFWDSSSSLVIWVSVVDLKVTARTTVRTVARSMMVMSKI